MQNNIYISALAFWSLMSCAAQASQMCSCSLYKGTYMKKSSREKTQILQDQGLGQIMVNSDEPDQRHQCQSAFQGKGDISDLRVSITNFNAICVPYRE